MNKKITTIIIISILIFFIFTSSNNDDKFIPEHKLNQGLENTIFKYFNIYNTLFFVSNVRKEDLLLGNYHDNKIYFFRFYKEYCKSTYELPQNRSIVNDYKTGLSREEMLSLAETLSINVANIIKEFYLKFKKEDIIYDDNGKPENFEVEINKGIMYDFVNQESADTFIHVYMKKGGFELKYTDYNCDKIPEIINFELMNPPSQYFSHLYLFYISKTSNNYFQRVFRKWFEKNLLTGNPLVDEVYDKYYKTKKKEN